MSQEFANLDPSQHSMSFAGVPIQGFQEGTAMRLSNITPAFKSKVGIDGLVVRVKSGDKRGKVEFILASSSSCNALLSAIHNGDIASKNGAGVGVLYIRDGQGATVYEANKAWIVKAPDVELSDDETPRVWELECAKLVRVDAGR